MRLRRLRNPSISIRWAVAMVASFPFVDFLYFTLRRNSLHMMAVAVDTFNDSDVARPTG